MKKIETSRTHQTRILIQLIQQKEKKKNCLHFPLLNKFPVPSIILQKMKRYMQTTN